MIFLTSAVHCAESRPVLAGGSQAGQRKYLFCLLHVVIIYALIRIAAHMVVAFSLHTRAAWNVANNKGRLSLYQPSCASSHSQSLWTSAHGTYEESKWERNEPGEYLSRLKFMRHSTYGGGLYCTTAVDGFFWHLLCHVQRPVPFHSWQKEAELCYPLRIIIIDALIRVTACMVVWQ